MKTIITLILLLALVACKKKTQEPEPAPTLPAAPIVSNPAHSFYYKKVKGTGGVNELYINGTQYQVPAEGIRVKADVGNDIIIKANYPATYDSVVVDIFVDSLKREVYSVQGVYKFKI